MSKRPPIEIEGNALMDGSKECGPKTIGLEDFDGPSPSKGNRIKSQTNHKGSTFHAFLLLEKYHNNASLDLAMDLATDSNNFCFMVLLTTHITNTTKKHNIKKTQESTIPKLKPK